MAKGTGGDRARLKADDRLIDLPDDSALTLEAALAPHREGTLQRMRARQTVLCIQDGTDLDCAHLVEGEDLGGALHLQSSLVMSTDGLALGILTAQCTSQPPLPDLWLAGVRDCIAVAGQLPDTRLVCVMDRQEDLYALFHEPRAAKTVELLVRVQPDRRSRAQDELLAQVRQSEVRAEQSFLIPPQSIRPKKGQGRPKAAGREAHVALRYQEVELLPPPDLKAAGPLTVWVIHARETTAPADAEALEWFLLTTLPITGPEQAAECVRWFCLRGRIADWHRVLKRGCQLEDREVESAEELRWVIAIKMVSAWRILLMILLGRSAPESPAELLFSDLEIEVLRAISKRDFKSRYDAGRLGDAVRLVGHLGGYLGRANDPPPGEVVLWRGYEDLQLMRAGLELRSYTNDP